MFVTYVDMLLQFRYLYFPFKRFILRDIAALQHANVHQPPATHRLPAVVDRSKARIRGMKKQRLKFGLLNVHAKVDLATRKCRIQQL